MGRRSDSCRVCRRGVAAGEAARAAAAARRGRAGGARRLMLRLLELRLEAEPALCLACCGKLLAFYRFKRLAAESDAYFRAREDKCKSEEIAYTKEEDISGKVIIIPNPVINQESNCIKQELESEDTSDSDKVFSEFAVKLVNSEAIQIEDDSEAPRCCIRTDYKGSDVTDTNINTNGKESKRFSRRSAVTSGYKSSDSDGSRDDSTKPNSEDSDPDYNDKSAAFIKAEKLWCHIKTKKWKTKKGMIGRSTPLTAEKVQDWCTPLSKKSIPQVSSLAQMVQVKKIPLPLPTNSRKVTCEQCPKTFWTLKGRLKHTRWWHPGVTLQYCEICEKGVPRIEEHTLLMHNRNALPFQCDYCGRKFIYKKQLENHVAHVHMKEGLVACETCGKVLSSRGNLLSHIRIVHEGSRPHACRYCSKKFATKKGLVRHIRIHTKERPFACNECDKRFNTPGGLKIHLKVHYGIKNFICEMCGKGFVNSGGLKVHMMKHSSVRNFTCRHCGTKFKRRDNMYTHIKNKHGKLQDMDKK